MAHGRNPKESTGCESPPKSSTKPRMLHLNALWTSCKQHPTDKNHVVAHVLNTSPSVFSPPWCISSAICNCCNLRDNDDSIPRSNTWCKTNNPSWPSSRGDRVSMRAAAKCDHCVPSTRSFGASKSTVHSPVEARANARSTKQCFEHLARRITFHNGVFEPYLSQVVSGVASALCCTMSAASRRDSMNRRQRH